MLQSTSCAGELRSAFTKTLTMIGRNDMCPCGSGKKYKKCCGSISSATKGSKRPYVKRNVKGVPLERLLPVIIEGVSTMKKQGLILPEPD